MVEKNISLKFRLEDLARLLFEDRDTYKYYISVGISIIERLCFRLQSNKHGKFEMSFPRKHILDIYNNALNIGLDYACMEETIILPGRDDVLLDLVYDDDGYVNIFFL